MGPTSHDQLPLSPAAAPVRLPAPWRVAVVLWTASLALAVAGVTSQVYRFASAPDRTFRFVNLNEETSLGTWFSGGLLLTAALAVGLVALGEHQARGPFRWRWTGLTVLFAALSVDEITGLHERTQGPIRESLGLSGMLHFSWVLLAAPFLLVVGLLYARFLLALPLRTRRLSVVAAVLYVGGAVGVEMLGGIQASAHGEDNLAFALLAHVEELCEMLGAATFVYANLDYAARRFGGWAFAPATQLIDPPLRQAASMSGAMPPGGVRRVS